jgi:hypothetical protein
LKSIFALTTLCLPLWGQGNFFKNSTTIITPSSSMYEWGSSKSDGVEIDSKSREKE